MKNLIIALLLILPLAANAAVRQSGKSGLNATLIWEAPIEKENGQSLAIAEIRQYTIQMKVNNGEFKNIISISATTLRYEHRNVEAKIGDTVTYRMNTVAKYACMEQVLCTSVWSEEHSKTFYAKPAAVDLRSVQ